MHRSRTAAIEIMKQIIRYVDAGEAERAEVWVDEFVDHVTDYIIDATLNEIGGDVEFEFDFSLDEEDGADETEN